MNIMKVVTNEESIMGVFTFENGDLTKMITSEGEVIVPKQLIQKVIPSFELDERDAIEINTLIQLNHTLSSYAENILTTSKNLGNIIYQMRTLDKTRSMFNSDIGVDSANLIKSLAQAKLQTIRMIQKMRKELQKIDEYAYNQGLFVAYLLGKYKDVNKNTSSKALNLNSIAPELTSQGFQTLKALESEKILKVLQNGNICFMDGEVEIPQKFTPTREELIDLLNNGGFLSSLMDLVMKIFN